MPRTSYHLQAKETTTTFFFVKCPTARNRIPHTLRRIAKHPQQHGTAGIYNSDSVININIVNTNTNISCIKKNRRRKALLNNHEGLAMTMDTD
mmetsp:Transcript_18306/g.38166  ORF Transcript_18306/g.38166 Transcript_18306/m.38166 type:complete len:93 (+) Transcript_18306:1495-1773(+)